VTKDYLILAAKALWTEAHAADPWGSEALAEAVLGSAVWVWSNLTCRQLHNLRAAIYPIVLEARGS
jgi:hypothetical protein